MEAITASRFAAAMSGALYVPPIANPVVHQKFEVPVEIVQTGNAFADSAQLGHTIRAHGLHGHPERLHGHRLRSSHDLDPRDVTV
jgi:hypothetical protein